MADLYLKKKDVVLYIIIDIGVEDNDVEKDDKDITASILTIFSDVSKPQIGTQMDGQILGNTEYNLNKLSEENIKAYEDGLRVALQWLLDDKIITKLEISTEKIGNRLNVQITFTTDSENQDNLIYSLEEKLEIL